MSNENNAIEIIIAPKANCSVSYSLNNEQPVRSTHIGDQPLFYMDFEDNYEEDEGFMESFAEQIDEIDSEYFSASVERSKYDEISSRFSKDKNWRENLLRENSAFISGITCPEADLEIDALLNILKQSGTFSAHYNVAKEKGLKIEMARSVSTIEYQRGHNAILVNPQLNKEDALLLISRELRRFWQKDNGTQINPLNFHPDFAVIVNRAQIADLNVFAVHVAWELQLAGQKDLWSYVEHSSLSDISRAFAREACTDFRTMNNGEAAQAAFEAWFLSERCRKTDKILIQQMLSEYKGYAFGSDPSASRNVAYDLLSRLGAQPFGKNYLEPYVAVILNDPVFTEVRDRSNANFLWFIKFERSFKESEQELQSEDPEKIINTISGTKERKNDQSEENIVHLQENDSESDDRKIIHFKPKG